MTSQIAQPQPKTLFDMPPEIVTMIIKKMPLSDALNFRTTCHAINNMFQNEGSSFQLKSFITVQVNWSENTAQKFQVCNGRGESMAISEAMWKFLSKKGDIREVITRLNSNVDEKEFFEKVGDFRTRMWTFNGPTVTGEMLNGLGRRTAKRLSLVLDDWTFVGEEEDKVEVYSIIIHSRIERLAFLANAVGEGTGDLYVEIPYVNLIQYGLEDFKSILPKMGHRHEFTFEPIDAPSDEIQVNEDLNKLANALKEEYPDHDIYIEDWSIAETIDVIIEAK